MGNPRTADLPQSSAIGSEMGWDMAADVVVDWVESRDRISVLGILVTSPVKLLLLELDELELDEEWLDELELDEELEELDELDELDEELDDELDEWLDDELDEWLDEDDEEWLDDDEPV